jgi:tetratricopeptide (TPR) repeat protein
MYRRNITSLLVSLGLALLWLLAYQLWVKPLVATTTSIAPASLSASVDPAPEERRMTPPSQRLQADLDHPRAIEFVATQGSRDGSLLEAIRDDIERADLTAAEAKLTALPARLSSESDTKSSVAILWNNLALQRERLQGTAQSITAFQKAAGLDERNPVIQLNLAHAYWAQRDRALDRTFLTRLLRVAPEDPFPHLALADLLYEEDNLQEAAVHLEHATNRITNDSRLRSYLETVTGKVRRAHRAEARMTSRSSSHFMVKFDGAEDQGTWTSVLAILEDGYRDIGQRLGHFPSKPIVVVLHTAESFQGATGSPAWADGLYDPVLGRIHVPTQAATTDIERLTGVLRHEYVHALLHDRVGAGGGVIPTWLNEGLAMQLAGTKWPDLDQAMQGDIQIIPLQYLEASWGRLPQQAAMLAYLEANSAVHFLIERWGMSRVDVLLTALKGRETLSTALQGHLFLSYDQFHSQWLDTFHTPQHPQS